MIGDALGDAYEHASDQISFVANTVIDTVERVAKCAQSPTQLPSEGGERELNSPARRWP